MKAVKEALSATRVKLTVEVPFEELRPSLDAAYKKIAGQVRVQGFRPGKVPPRVLDQRVGRPAILDEAIQHAVPRFYTAAVGEQEIEVLGQPAVDITSFADGGPLVFTAEVDIRPDIDLPDYAGMPVTVDEVTVSDDDLSTQLDQLRDRFAVLEAVDRAVELGDFVTIDVDVTRDGAPVDGGGSTGLSYHVGTDSLLSGLDEQLIGMTTGQSASFASKPSAADDTVEPADVTVTVCGVKRKSLPALDDDFATTASEFDSVAELRADISRRLERVKRLQQGLQARDRVLEALLERVEVALPEAAVADEAAGRMHQLGHQLESVGQTLDGYLEAQAKSREQFDTEVREGAELSVRASLVLDAIARKEQLDVNDAEVTDQVVRRAQRVGLDPRAYADQLVRSGEVQALVGEIVRGKALALVMEAAAVTDTTGAEIDLNALTEAELGPAAPGPAESPAEPPAEPPADTPADPRADADGSGAVLSSAEDNRS